MHDDDKDALAGEYVLGTLSDAERDQAEALISIDPGFEAAVRQWERRLGELNVMVEAVEPPPEVWDSIKAGMFAPASDVGEAGEETEPEPAAEEKPAAEEEPPLAEAVLEVSEEPHGPETVASLPEAVEAVEPAKAQDIACVAEVSEAAEVSETMAAPAAVEPAAALPASEAPEEPSSLPALSPLPAFGSLFAAEGEQTPAAAPAAPAEAAADQAFVPPPPPAEPGRIEHSADVVYLAGRLRRWQRMTLVLAVVAALLALYVAVWQVAPSLIPAQLQPTGAGMMVAHSPAAEPAPVQLRQDRLVAVLQQEPTAPAFLLTLDTRNRMLTVRRVSAAAEAGHSYELWLISKRFPTPRSLGIVGDSEFTQRAFPANYDVETLQAASYAVSLEPAGGSPSGVPTGPVLFTGKAVESLPTLLPPKT